MRLKQKEKRSEHFRSGFVSVIGRPNVGKSTLMNRLLGQKIAAVSARPQTTQRNQLGIITTNDYQIVFIDTPGIHQPYSKLGNTMNDAATGTFTEVDLLLWIMDGSMEPTAEDCLIAERIENMNLLNVTVLALNKADLLKGNISSEKLKVFTDLAPGAEYHLISAEDGSGVKELLDSLVSRLPEGPEFYDPEQITDLFEREIARDLIRESVLNNLEDEVPHAIAVRVEDYKDRTEKNSYIAATLLLDREAHKPIVIEKGGMMDKKHWRRRPSRN